MRFRLRTLLIVLAMGPVVMWGVFALWMRTEAWRESQRVRPGMGMVINVPALGPQPVAFDFAFPVAPPPTPDPTDPPIENASPLP
jgi:hypothetical protein